MYRTSVCPGEGAQADPDLWAAPPRPLWFSDSAYSEALASVLPVLGPPETAACDALHPRCQHLVPLYRVATNPGQDEQEAGGQGQEHQNDDEQRDVEASSSPKLGVKRQLVVPQGHAATWPSAAAASKLANWVCFRGESPPLVASPGPTSCYPAVSVRGGDPKGVIKSEPREAQRLATLQCSVWARAESGRWEIRIISHRP